MPTVDSWQVQLPLSGRSFLNSLLTSNASKVELVAQGMVQFPSLRYRDSLSESSRLLLRLSPPRPLSSLSLSPYFRVYLRLPLVSPLFITLNINFEHLQPLLRLPLDSCPHSTALKRRGVVSRRDSKIEPEVCS